MKLFCALLCTFLFNFGDTYSQTFTVGKNSSISFDAALTMGSFSGRAESLTGSISLDLTKNELVEGQLVIAVDSLTTGLSLRDKHMKNKYLHGKKHPQITATIIGKQKFTFEKASKIKVRWSMHGQTKEQEITVTLHDVKKTATPSPQITSLTAKCQFDLNILDFGIEQPKYMIMSMDPVLKMQATIVFKKN